MTNHMHVAIYFPNAYEGRLGVGEGEYSIAEIATLNELSPILKRFGEWVVTTEGVECLTSRYFIAKDRFDENDWVPHMREKTWVNIDDFTQALQTGIDFVRLEII